MPEALEGEPGTAGCAAGEMPDHQHRHPGRRHRRGQRSRCVWRLPQRSPSRSRSTTTRGRISGQDVDYTITVTNNGSTSGSTSFVDDFDNAVNPGEVTSDPTGGTCEESNGTLACESKARCKAKGYADVHLHSRDARDVRGRVRHRRLCDRDVPDRRPRHVGRRSGPVTTASRSVWRRPRRSRSRSRPMMSRRRRGRRSRTRSRSRTRIRRPARRLRGRRRR